MTDDRKDQVSEHVRKTSETDQEVIYYFIANILDKRYQLYYWMDNKTNLLLLINTVLTGLCYFLVDKGERFLVPPVPQLLIFAALIFLFTSIVQCLLLIIPKMKSPLWKSKTKAELIVKQVRSTVGIEKFTPSEYETALKALDFDTIVQMNADQIKKMNSIIVRDSRGVKRGVVLTVLASFLVFASVVLAFFFAQP